MAALIGIMVDVSGSMRQSASVSRYQRGDSRVNEEGVKWARSIFKVVDQVIKHDVSSGNQVFVIGYGADKPPYTFDLLNTIRNATVQNRVERDTTTKEQVIKDTLDNLEQNGAPYVREWASVGRLSVEVTDEEAILLFTILTTNHEFRRKFVSDCLPEVCRKKSATASTVRTVSSSPATYGVCAALPLLLGPVGIGLAISVVVAKEKTRVKLNAETSKSIRESIDKGVALAWKLNATSVAPTAIIGVNEASKILHGCIDKEDHLTEERVDTLMKTVEPFIYGVTPMIEALSAARDLFAEQKYANHNKVLFILSDGLPTDDKGILPDLSSLHVNVMGCYITEQDIPDPRCLYSTERDEWDKGAKFMFKISSSISTQLLPRTIFVKRGWTLEIMNNRTKLFAQVNHPGLVDEVSSLARDVICSQDALSDILASVSLDVYINKANEGFGAQRQVGGTCYANASAVALHLAMKRIVGREGGYPDFFDLRSQIIAKYGKCGANTMEVLQEMCPEYRLHCQEVDTYGAMKAITAKRPVLARFRLTDQEWTLFSNFYAGEPRGILSVDDIDIRQRPPGAPLGGHAVILTSFSSNGLRFMNSWGTNWADNGFFRVRNSAVIDVEFVDVYWTLNDLTAFEQEAYKQEGPKIAEKLITSLKGLRTSIFTCPLCAQASGSSEFTGQLVRAKCPKCQGEFNPKDHEAYDLELIMYLTSLYQ